MTTARELSVDSPFEAARTPLEASVARILAEVLEIDRFGRTDSFYDFGGTSLQAIRVCARIEAETGRRVQPGWLLEHDVLADFAARVEASDAG
ncbi:phosphopantetheine-binding protein [Paractinoplanes toevensis]|uniref:Carrier domain-containing protein n=1 Tax=Paractinoplanes toevensis TaxID=571911 RepID=A0A919TCU7_9ACTN|nr:phosphopantetheine-binding protein [Actinoplanes toevensis]GIM91829.1 hypothetical protein Ato02nite_036220 [Actinoplanes toevensis]